MDAKHTPGPWNQEEVTSTERHIFDDLGEDGLLGPIAILRHCDPVELEANARLVAAAPCLLELLQELIDIEGQQPGTAAWANKVRDAISKATGAA